MPAATVTTTRQPSLPSPQSLCIHSSSTPSPSPSQHSLCSEAQASITHVPSQYPSQYPASQPLTHPSFLLLSAPKPLIPSLAPSKFPFLLCLFLMLVLLVSLTFVCHFLLACLLSFVLRLTCLCPDLSIFHLCSSCVLRSCCLSQPEPCSCYGIITFTLLTCLYFTCLILFCSVFFNSLLTAFFWVQLKLALAFCVSLPCAKIVIKKAKRKQLFLSKNLTMNLTKLIINEELF